jgi:hypothetical protein
MHIDGKRVCYAEMNFDGFHEVLAVELGSSWQCFEVEFLVTSMLVKDE